MEKLHDTFLVNHDHIARKEPVLLEAPSPRRSFDICIVVPLCVEDNEDMISKDKLENTLARVCRAHVGSSLRELNSRLRFHPVYELDELKDLRRSELQQLIRKLILNVLRHLMAEYREEVEEHEHGRFLSIHCRLTEAGAMTLASYLRYPLQAARDSSPHEEYKQDPDYYPPYFPYENNVEYEGQKCVWARYSSESNPQRRADGRCLPSMFPSEGSLFRDVDRIRLLYYGIYEFLNVELMAREFGLIETWYCLKNDIRERALHQPGLTTESNSVDAIRSYYGEYVATHCFWLSYMGKILLAPACFLTLLHLVQTLMPISTAEWHNHHIPVLGLAYAIFVVVWVNLAVRCWVREERLAALRWGQTEVASTGPADDCPYAVAKFYKSDPVKPNHYVHQIDHTDRNMRWLLSALVMMLLLCLTCGSFVMIFHKLVDESRDIAPPDPHKLIIITESHDTMAMIKFHEALRQMLGWLWMVELSAIYITISAKVSTIIFEQYFVEPLARYENHSSLQVLKQSVDTKIFVYKIFVNTFSIASLWRMTMLRQNLSNDHFALRRLNKSVAIQVACFHCSDIGWRYVCTIYRYLKMRKRGLHTRAKAGHAELLREDYVRITGTLSLDKVVEFSNIAMFSIACPSLPLISLGATLVDLKLNEFALKQCRRPYPLGIGGNLGMCHSSVSHRNDLLRSTGFLSILTNVMFCMLSTPTQHETLTWKLVSVLCLLVGGLGVKDLIDYKLPTLSSRYARLRSQMEFHLHELLWGKG